MPLLGKELVMIFDPAVLTPHRVYGLTFVIVLSGLYLARKTLRYADALSLLKEANLQPYKDIVGVRIP